MNQKVIYKRIIVVDDDDNIRKILIDLLETISKRNQNGKVFLVEEACNGQEAWLKIDGNKEFDYDLVITDIVMPEMDGITLKNKIEARFPETKIIILSGNAFPPENCSHFLQKPFSFREFIKTINLLIN